MTDEPSPASRRAIDHPGTLGDLTDVFLRRRIAAGADGGGQIFLARPDSVIADAGTKGERRDAIVRVVAEFDPEQANRISRLDSIESGGLLRIEVPASEPATINDERRWSLAAADETRMALSQAGVPTIFNIVFVGEQSFVGHPLGANASWAGELAFAGRTATTSRGTTTILTTAEPAAAPAFLRSRLDLGRDQPRVLVLDTGLRTLNGEGTAPEHDALGICVVDGTFVASSTVGAADDEDEPDDDETGTLDFEAGHGTFISGIVRQICPDAIIEIAGVLSSFGDGDISTVLPSLERAMRRAASRNQTIDIVVMSFGGFFPDDEASVFEAALTDLLGSSVAVAATGNNFTCRPCFPAAFRDVIAVGGLGPDGKAWFTNFGGWVDACAPAVDVVSTFFTDFTETIDKQDYRHYEGWARWSGTSFSAPKVAALIAQEMYLFGGTAEEAWKRMTSHKHFRYPDLGIVFNV